MRTGLISDLANNSGGIDEVGERPAGDEERVGLDELVAVGQRQLVTW